MSDNKVCESLLNGKTETQSVPQLGLLASINEASYHVIDDYFQWTT